MTPQLYAACQQAAHVITTEGRIIKAGRASLFVLAEVSYPRWLVRPFTWPPLIWFVECGYRVVANHRSFFDRFLFTGETDEQS